MKKNRNSKKQPQRRKKTSVAREQPTRRTFISRSPYVLAGLAAAVGVGAWGVSSVAADLAEQDLSVVGSGTPVIVQIHNPSCPICLGLQKETRAALDQLDDEGLAYRVASITSTVGSDFANQHGATYATLLFFDGTGNVVDRVQGTTDRDVLYEAFKAHVANGR